MSRPLRSTTTPASSGFPATTSRSASERLNRYSMPPVSAVGTLPLAARRTDPQAPDGHFQRSPSHVPCKSRRPGSRRLHAGHHLASNHGHPPGSSRECRGSPVSMPSLNFDASTTTPGPQPAKPDASGTPSWSPPDRVKPSLLPDRSPRRSSANAAPGGLTPTPAGPTPEGQQASISRTAPPMKNHLLHQSSFGVRDAPLLSIHRVYALPLVARRTRGSAFIARRVSSPRSAQTSYSPISQLSASSAGRRRGRSGRSPGFPRQQGGCASSLVCPHLREDADVMGRLELPPVSPLAQLAASPAAKRRERSIRGPCLSAKRGRPACSTLVNDDCHGRPGAAPPRPRWPPPSAYARSERRQSG